MKITTVASAWEGAMATVLVPSLSSICDTLVPMGNSPADKHDMNNREAANNRINGNSCLLFGIQLKVYHSLLLTIKRADGLAGTRSALVIGLYFIIHIGIQAVKVIQAISLCDERPHLQSLSVFQLDD